MGGKAIDTESDFSMDTEVCQDNVAHAPPHKTMDTDSVSMRDCI